MLLEALRTVVRSSKSTNNVVRSSKGIPLEALRVKKVALSTLLKNKTGFGLFFGEY